MPVPRTERNEKVVKPVKRKSKPKTRNNNSSNNKSEIAKDQPNYDVLIGFVKGVAKEVIKLPKVKDHPVVEILKGVFKDEDK